ncbi:MAG TPA: PP2C family protein-serine/threonine phosphatase [Thermoanaerobaculia bacterium]|nr:PP2C family protein-serine/threonine phosphatase [Thermoanaerobaculia bacterium]
MEGTTVDRHGSGGRLLRHALISFGSGTAIGLLLGISERSSQDRAITVAISSICGVCIFAAARSLSWLLHGFLSRLAGAAQKAAYTTVFAFSGIVAFLAVQVAAKLLFHIHFGGSLPFYLGLTGAAAVFIGFIFVTVDRLRLRLEESVARLKETEFAEKELQLARALQSRLLPPPELAAPGYRMAARNLAARVVAGDFYDAFRLADGALGLAVADVAGKGMAAALIMASVKAMLPLLAAERPAAETLRELNRRLAGELSPREFVALAFARYEPASGRLELANAGLPDPYLLPAGGAPVALVVPGPRLPLGVRPEVDYLSVEVALGPADRVLLLTDGLAEALTAVGEPLGYPALARLVAAAPAPSPLLWIDGLLERVRQATRPVLEDDWTALLLERVANDQH